MDPIDKHNANGSVSGRGHHSSVGLADRDTVAVLRVWAARGQRLANEAILHEPPPSRMSSKNVAKGKSPLQGNKNLDPKSAIQQKLLTARMLCGFYEDYYKGSINTGQSESPSQKHEYSLKFAPQDLCASSHLTPRACARPSSKQTKPWPSYRNKVNWDPRSDRCTMTNAKKWMKSSQSRSTSCMCRSERRMAQARFRNSFVIGKHECLLAKKMPHLTLCKDTAPPMSKPRNSNQLSPLSLVSRPLKKMALTRRLTWAKSDQRG